MGVNNRQRRAAKQRKRARQRTGQPASGPGQSHEPFAADPGWDESAAYGLVDLMVTSTVRRISRRKLDEAELRFRAESLVRRVEPTPRYVLESVVSDLLARLAEGVVRGGWGPADLAELIRRGADPGHLPVLAAALHEDARRHTRQGAGWRTALEAVGPEDRLRLDTTDRLASGLQVAALLATAPLVTADGVTSGDGRGSSSAEHPKLARVRALLAKAESTNFDEEAEALSAKAQELISRYALDRLLSQTQHEARRNDPGMRRIWLDAPYVRAKAALVHEVASANRCQAAVTESLGFCLVVGDSADLDAVELLSTSLLVQANAAMLRHGRRLDHAGASRTRSFRQSFLLAYAGRIGERLRAATSEVTTSEEAERALPVLRDHEARVAAAFERMVPHTVEKTSNITDAEGWAAGLAAADLALLDVNGQISEQTG